MKRSSDTRVMAGAIGAAALVLVAGAVTAAAMTRSPVSTLSAAPADAASTDVQGAPQPQATQAQGSVTQVSQPKPEDGGSLSMQVLELAADKAPFDPERRAPEGRYLFPEERVVPRPPREPERPPETPFRVVGVIAGTSGQVPRGSTSGVAVVQPDGQAPKLLKVGEEFMGFRIKSVEGNVVVASSRGWDLNLPVEALQPTRIGANNNRNQRNGQENAREQERQLNQVRQRLEALSGQLQGQFQLDGGPLGFEMRDGNAVITGPNGQRIQIRVPEGTDAGVIERLIVAPPTRAPARPGGGGQER